MAQGSGRPLEELPVELLQAILAAAPDIKTLEAAVMTGPCLYNAFKGAEEFIVRSVVLRQFDADLLHDVLATHASSKTQDWSIDQAEKFFTSYFARDQHHFVDSMEWKLSQARSIGRFDGTVQYFVDHIVTKFLSTYTYWNDTQVVPPTKLERNRISRSLYRFETFCNLYPFWKYALRYDTGKLYIDNFAPWENEQLVCVSESLYKNFILPELTLRKQILVLLDPKLRSNWPEPIPQFTSWIFQSYVESHLFRGLTHIRRFALEKDTDLQQIAQVIRVTRLDGMVFHSFINDMTRLLGRKETPNLDDFNPEDEEKYIPRPWFRDPDSGPEDIWRWANQWNPRKHFFAARNAQNLRSWLYVMWDRWRIDEMRVLNKSRPWPYGDR
ncbi:similar to An11g09220 [Aspergillus luchuensis IFO 4308]|nr:similar to An11g09220 [Aspergillus luchuensis IFO 4308]